MFPFQCLQAYYNNFFWNYVISNFHHCNCANTRITTQDVLSLIEALSDKL